MTKADIVNEVAQATGIAVSDTAAAVGALLETISQALVEGHRIELRGFGVFETVLRAPRTVHNRWTGSRVKIPSRRVARFRPARGFRSLGDRDLSGGGTE